MEWYYLITITLSIYDGDYTVDYDNDVDDDYVDDNDDTTNNNTLLPPKFTSPYRMYEQ